MLGFCGLSCEQGFLQQVRQFRVQSENNKWRAQLTLAQQRLLEASLQEYLLRYGYERAQEPACGR